MAGGWERTAFNDPALSPATDWFELIGERRWRTMAVRVRSNGLKGFLDAFRPSTAADVNAIFRTLGAANIQPSAASVVAAGLVDKSALRESEGAIVDFSVPPTDAAQDAIRVAEANEGDEFTVLSIDEAPQNGYAQCQRSGAFGGIALPDDAVIMAIVDDGIGVANRRFRASAAQTRFLAFVDLDQRDNAGDPTCRMFDTAEINALLAAHADDEDAIYRAMGMIDTTSDRRQPLRYRTSHGTHILDLMAGYDATEVEEAGKRPILAVQLPSSAIEDRSDSQMHGALRQALYHIFASATEIASSRTTAPPLVLNFSFGMFAGPHDGTSLVEEMLQLFPKAYTETFNAPCEVVLAGGNGFQARCIAELHAGRVGLTQTLPWRLLPDDRTSSFVEIWSPPSERTGSMLSARLQPPTGGAPSPETGLNERLVWSVDGRPLAAIYAQALPNRRQRITVAVRPTADEGGDPTGCPAGLWSLGVKNQQLSAHERIDVRIQRDDPVSFRRATGRQSYFDDPSYRERHPLTGERINFTSCSDGPVTRRRTLSAYTPPENLVVVGGMRRSDGEPALYSAAGPTSSVRLAPDLAAPSEESPSHHGVLGSGTYSSSVMALNGTSVAAPVVAREIGRRFAAAAAAGAPPPKAVESLKQELRDAETAGIDGPHGRYPPQQQDRTGAGRFVTHAPRHRTRIESG